MHLKSSNKKAYKNINKDTDATLNKSHRKMSTKLFTSAFVEEFTAPSKPNIKNPVVIAIDGPGLYVGSVRIPYVRPPIVLPAFYESQREHLKNLIKRIDSAGIHKSSKIIPKSLCLTFDQDVLLDRAPVDSFLKSMNKRINDAKPAPATVVKHPEPTLFEMLQADTLKAVSAPNMQQIVAKEEEVKVVVYSRKEQTLATQLAIGAILRNEGAPKTEHLVSTRPTVAYKDIPQTLATDPLQTLSSITLTHLKKLGKGNFAALGIDNTMSSQANASAMNDAFQDASGLLHFNRIQIDPREDVEDIISKIDAKKYQYSAFDFLNKPLIRVDETFQPLQDSKQLFLAPQETLMKNVEKPILPPHFLANFISLVSFECRTQHPNVYRCIPFIESLTALPHPDSQDARRFLDLICSLIPLPLSAKLTLEYITLYNSLSGLQKLSARLRILFRERVLTLLATQQGLTRIKLARIYMDCAGDKEYAVEVMLKEGAMDVKEVIGDNKELLGFAIGVLLGDLKSSAPFERIRALDAIDSLVSGLNLHAILNESENDEKQVNSDVAIAAKTLIEEVLVMAWEDWSLDVKELSIKVISDLNLQSEIYKGIVLQLSSLNCTKQITAIKRVGEFKIVKGMAGLLPCLTNSHVIVRIEAFRALAMFDLITDREVLSGILVGSTDCEADVRIAALQGINAQIRESLYYLLHYDPIERVREEVVLAIHALSLVAHFQASLTLIYNSLKRCKFQEIIHSALNSSGIFILKTDEKTASMMEHSEILMGPESYENMSVKEREVVERVELVSEKEEEQLLQRVSQLCTKEAIISQATNHEYIPLIVPALKLK